MLTTCLDPGDDELYNSLIGRRKLLNKLIREIESRQKNEPEGRLRISHYKGNAQYYHVMNDHQPLGHYIKKSDTDLVRSLAQKSYNSSMIRELSRAYSFVNHSIRQYERHSLKYLRELRNAGGADRRSLISPYFVTDDEYVSSWLSEKYESLPFPEQYPEYTTIQCERVRSKSEILIANAFHMAAVPYKYEAPFTLGERTVYPDFRVLNVRTRTEYVWEHFGMMDNPEYQEDALRKITAYEEHQVFPGTQLIMTFETQRQPLNTRIVNHLIRQYLQ